MLSVPAPHALLHGPAVLDVNVSHARVLQGSLCVAVPTHAPLQLARHVRCFGTVPLPHCSGQYTGSPHALHPPPDPPVTA